MAQKRTQKHKWEWRGDDATAYHWEMEDFYFTNICESTGNHNIVIIYSSSNYCIFFPMTSVRRTKHNIYWYVFSRSSTLRALFCIMTGKNMLFAQKLNSINICFIVSFIKIQRHSDIVTYIEKFPWDTMKKSRFNVKKRYELTMYHQFRVLVDFI